MREKLTGRVVLIEFPDGDRAEVTPLPAFTDAVVLSILSAPPSAPSKYDAHIVGSGPSGAFTGRADLLAFWNEGWYFLTPWTGMRAWDIATQRWYRFLGFGAGGWTTDLGVGDLTVDDVLFLTREVLAALSGGQASGANITKPVTVVTPVSGANDDVTLPGLEVHKVLVVLNRGSGTLNVYPASGDQIEALGANNPTTIASGAGAIFIGDTSVWRRAGLS